MTMSERTFVILCFIVMFLLMKVGYGNESPMSYDSYSPYAGEVQAY